MGKLKKIILISLLFIISKYCLIGQTINNSTNNSNAQTNRTSLNSSIDETTILLDGVNTDSTNNQPGTSFSSKSSNWFFIRMVIVLILVVVAIYFMLRFFKKKANPEVEDSEFMRRVASINIAPGRTVEIVTLLDNKGYVLGVTESNINLIAEIGNTSEEKELISALNLNADKKQKNNKPANFSDVLEMFIGKGKNSNNSIFKETEQKVDEFVQDNLSNDEES